jgi:hypothetical protein
MLISAMYLQALQAVLAAYKGQAQLQLAAQALLHILH